MAATVEGIIERRELAIRDEYNSGLTNMVGSVMMLWIVRRRAKLAGAVTSVDFRKLHFSVHLSAVIARSKK